MCRRVRKRSGGLFPRRRVKAADDPLGRQRAVDLDPQPFAIEVVQHVQQPKCPTIPQSVGHEIHGPGHVWGLGHRQRIRVSTQWQPAPATKEIRTLHEGILADGVKVPLAKFCAWFGVPRRTVYDKPTKAAPKVAARFAELIKAMIEKEPSFRYRTVAWLLGFNKNTVQRIFQIKGWQVRKRPIGMRPRIEAVPRVATAPNERWSTDLCRVWAGCDGWTTLTLVIDCHTRELLVWHLSRSGKSTTAASALEHALINRFGTLGKVTREFLLRSDNGLVFTSHKYTALVQSYGLKQEFITPQYP
jgi:putative transposase